MSIFANNNTSIVSSDIKKHHSYLFLQSTQVQLLGFFDGNNAFLGSLVVKTLKGIIPICCRIAKGDKTREILPKTMLVLIP